MDIIFRDEWGRLIKTVDPNTTIVFSDGYANFTDDEGDTWEVALSDIEEII